MISRKHVYKEIGEIEKIIKDKSVDNKDIERTNILLEALLKYATIDLKISTNSRSNQVALINMLKPFMSIKKGDKNVIIDASDGTGKAPFNSIDIISTTNEDTKEK